MDYYDIDWQQPLVWLGLIAAVLLLIGLAYAIAWLLGRIFEDD